MRPRLVLTALVWSALPACSGKGGPSTAQHQVAATVHTLYHAWDDAAFRRIRPAGTDGRVLQRRLEWFRERLGDCGPPTLMELRDHRSARFEYACARGAWEIAITLARPGEAAGAVLADGARDQEPPPLVLARANAALDLFHRGDDRRMHKTFGSSFDRVQFPKFLAETHRQWGGCMFAGVDLASPTGALLNLDCEIGPRLMVVDVDPDGRIGRFFLQGRRAGRAPATPE